MSFYKNKEQCLELCPIIAIDVIICSGSQQWQLCEWKVRADLWHVAKVEWEGLMTSEL